MKNLRLFVLSTLFATQLNSQTTNWNKDDRSNLYSDCMSYTTKYKNITAEQKESICLCYLEETTKKFIKADFEAKIDIELKRLKDATLSQCAKNIGVDLSTQFVEKPVTVETKQTTPEPAKGTVSKESLMGVWRTDMGETLEFKDGGKYSEVTSKGITRAGDWFLDEEGVLTLIIEVRKTNPLTKKEKTERITQRFDFISFSKSFFKMSNRADGAVLQANKIK